MYFIIPAPGERDLVLLNNQIEIEWPGQKMETREISMVAYGDPKGYSAMARTVSVPAAIAARMILDGESFKPSTNFSLFLLLFFFIRYVFSSCQTWETRFCHVLVL